MWGVYTPGKEGSLYCNTLSPIPLLTLLVHMYMHGLPVGTALTSTLQHARVSHQSSIEHSTAGHGTMPTSAVRSSTTLPTLPTVHATQNDQRNDILAYQGSLHRSCWNARTLQQACNF